MSDDKFAGLRKAVRIGYQVGTDEIRALLDEHDRLRALIADNTVTVAFGDPPLPLDDAVQEIIAKQSAIESDAARYGCLLNADPAWVVSLFESGYSKTEIESLIDANIRGEPR